MRFFIDENTSPKFAETMNSLYPQHGFIHSEQLKMRGVLDIPMIRRLAKRGDVDALITKDTNQWADPDERRAIMRSGLHWLAHREPPFTGPRQVAFLTAAYLTALDVVVGRIDETGNPVWCRVSNVPHGDTQRVKFLH